MRLRGMPVEVTLEVVLRAILTGKMDMVASWLAKEIVSRYPRASIAARYFRFWEGNGFHITESHFYPPIPDTRELPEELRQREAPFVGVEMNELGQLRLLRNVFPQFRQVLHAVYVDRSPHGGGLHAYCGECASC